MANSTATVLENLRLVRDNIIAEVKTETDLWAASTGGSRPTYSLDGQSISWDQWLANRLEQIDKLTAQINKLSWAAGPVDSYARA